MLGALDPITWNPQRIAVAGVSGSGKSTLARRISALTTLPYTEMDSLFHGTNWVPRPTFEVDVDNVTTQNTWITEWQYGAVRQRIAGRADTLVWLDPPTPVTMTRLIRRTVIRRIKRQELWNGNHEVPLWHVFVDPDHVIRWGFRTRNKLRGGRLRELEREFPNLRIVRLRSQHEVDLWCRALPKPAPPRGTSGSAY